MSIDLLKRYYLLLILALMLLVSCQQPSTDKNLTTNTFEEKVFAVNIVPGDSSLEAYLNYHQHIWPEVEAGFKKAGYKSITLSHFKHLVVMRVVVPRGADLDSMSRVAESSDPKCKKWNQVMGKYQMGVPGTTADQKWVELTPFYRFENE